MGRPFEGFARLIRNRRQQGSSGDGASNQITIPRPPSVMETPTGITTESPETRAADDPGMTEVALAQGTVDAIAVQSEADFQAAKGLKDEAVGFQEGVTGQVSDTGERIEGIQGDIATAQTDLDLRIDAALTAVEDIPNQVSTEFDRLRNEFGDISAAALADVDTKATAALGQVMDGRATAMQAAVQGIQGNINTAVSKIQSDPNLTQAQKASMIAQTRLAGASSIAPAIGANILAFNQLAADVATKFGSFTTQVQTQIVSEEGAFGRAGGTAFAQATVASQEITGQLLSTQATSNAAYANSQATLEGIRSQAEMSGNQLLLDNMPNLEEPVLNGIDTASAAMTLGTDLITRDFERVSIRTEQDITVALLQYQIGTPGSRIWDSVRSGFETGGFRGAAMGAIGGFLSERNNPAPTFGLGT